MSLSSYLASKYLTADKSSEKKSKKRKRKQAEASAGLIIADDDDMSWTKTAKSDDEDGPQIANSGSAEFRKAKKNSWKVVGTPALAGRDEDGAAAADRIIADAAMESAAAGHADEAPVVEDDGVIKMSDGTHAGLQTGAAVSAQMARRKREEEEAWKEEERRLRKEGKKVGNDETAYRDATGRRIDISMKRAEARREAEAKALKEKEEKEAAKGDVQRKESARRREELEDAKFMPLTRTADDEDMNKELKERDRWNDPAAMFMSEEKRKGRKSSNKKMYTGASAPNRYGIRPGHKWDGVDRGNGWESERFKAINRKVRNKDLDFAWQMDT